MRFLGGEDLGRAGDITALACIDADARLEATFGARKAGTIAGLAGGAALLSAGKAAAASNVKLTGIDPDAAPAADIAARGFRTVFRNRAMAFVLIAGGEVFHRFTLDLAQLLAGHDGVDLQIGGGFLRHDLRVRAICPCNLLIGVLTGAQGSQRNTGEHDMKTRRHAGSPLSQ